MKHSRRESTGNATTHQHGGLPLPTLDRRHIAMRQGRVHFDLGIERFLAHPQDPLSTILNSVVVRRQLRRGRGKTLSIPQFTAYLSNDPPRDGVCNLSVDYLGLARIVERIELPACSHARRICASDRVWATRAGVRSRRG
jgi:hypothetical protein